jgi:predicted acylesterase/phospholipase RssA
MSGLSSKDRNKKSDPDVSSPRIAAALSGGGAKGMVQVGSLDVVLNEYDIRFDIVSGISVGALAASMLAQNKFDRYKELFFDLRSSDIYSGSITSPLNIARIAFGRNYIYDNTALWNLIQREIDPRAFTMDVKIGAVDLVTGSFLSYDYRHRFRRVFVTANNDTIIREAPVEEYVRVFQRAILASTAIPVTFPPVDFGEHLLVDGGVHMISPLGNLIDDEPNDVYIFNCEPVLPRSIPPGKKNIFQIGARSLDLVLNRIILSDVREFRRINKNVKEAARHGVTLHNEKGKAYKYYRSYLFEPTIDIGETLDFSEPTQRMRYDHGVEIARDVMKRRKKVGTITGE